MLKLQPISPLMSVPSCMRAAVLIVGIQAMRYTHTFHSVVKMRTCRAREDTSSPTDT